MSDTYSSIALLVDGENVSPKYFSQIREDISRRGTINIFRIYADWTSERLAKGWKENVLSKYPFVAVQQFSSGAGKNSSDSALIIDTMDLVYEKNKRVNCIALVSSDSDFTRLVLNLREKEIFVLGYGEEKTPLILRNAFHEFVILKNDSSENKLEDTIKRFIIEKVDENDSCKLTDISAHLRRIKPDFDLQTDLGVPKLSNFFKKRKTEYILDKQDVRIKEGR